MFREVVSIGFDLNFDYSVPPILLWRSLSGSPDLVPPIGGATEENRLRSEQPGRKSGSIPDRLSSQTDGVQPILSGGRARPRINVLRTK